jgi:hypothetical protein
MARRRTTDTEPADLPRYLVWVRGLDGPEPQKWARLDSGMGQGRPPQMLAWLELPVEERSLSLSMLARRYPPPRIEGN